MKKLFVFCIGVVLPGLALAGPVNINSADARTIAAELDGVGLSKARAIVEYRARNGEFASADDVLNVKGIGRQILDANRANILVGNSDSG